MSRKFRFSLGSMPPDPLLYYAPKSNLLYSTKMQNLDAIILTNQLKATWLSSLGIPSNAVNILYVCYFLKLPKFLSPSRFFFFFFYNISLYQTMSVLYLWPFKTCSSHFFFIVSPSLILSFFFLFSLGGGGVEKAISINLGYKRGQPQIISNEQGDHHILQGLPVKFNHPYPKICVNLQIALMF